MECQICFEPVSDIYKVGCRSTVDHLICFECEVKWRAKMPVRNGTRTMTCPMCRRPETERTMDSLQREELLRRTPEGRLQDACGVIVTLFWCVIQVYGGRTLTEPPPRPRPVFCASGRDCRTRSRHSRTKTHLKCRTCQAVACCNSCRFCVACAPV